MGVERKGEERVGLYFQDRATGEERPVPLKVVDVKATTRDMVTRVDLTQRYCNDEGHAVEVVYVFPLDEQAAVCGFSVRIDGREIQGQVQEREEAHRTYDEAVAQGHGAYLMDQEKPDVFEIRVGNLPAGTVAEVKLSYVAQLSMDAGSAVRWVLPTAVAPRYAPSGAGPPASLSGTVPEARTACSGTASCHLSVEAEFNMPCSITSLDCPSGHAPQVNMQGRSARVTLEGASAVLGRDFVLLLEMTEPPQARLLLERHPDGRTAAAMVALVPKFELDDVKCELVFVVDRSGSMGGDKILQARHALQLFLRSLPADCYFNIVGFGSHFKALFAQGSVKYDEASLKAASTEAANLQADMGGTEILRPLQYVLNRPVIRGYTRQVFVLTDGQVWNTDEVFKLVRSRSHVARCFSLGIGPSASRHLVQGIARHGNGTAEFVSGSNRLQATVVQQLRAALQPALTDVSISWTAADGQALTALSASAPPADDAEARFAAGPCLLAESGAAKSLLGYSKPGARNTVAQPPAVDLDRCAVLCAPHHTPAVFSGSCFVAYALFQNGVQLPASCKIRAESPDGPLEVQLPVEHSPACSSAPGAASMVHCMAARAAIRDLEEGSSEMQERSLPGTEEEAQAAIVRLGLRYSLASKHTSFVAVEIRDGQSRQVAVQQHRVLAHSEGELLQQAASFSVMGACAQPRFFKAKGGAASHCRPAKAKACRGGPGGLFGFLAGGGGACESAASFAPQCTPPAAPMPPAPMAAAAQGFGSSSGAPRRRMGRAGGPASANLTDASLDTFFGCASLDPAVNMLEGSEDEEALEAAEEDCSALGAAAAPEQQRAVMMRLVGQQTFDGSFASLDSVASALHLEKPALLKAWDSNQPATLTADGGQSKLWATALAVAFLQLRCAALKQEWELLAEKAETWMLRQLSGGRAAVEKLVQAAKDALAAAS